MHTEPVDGRWVSSSDEERWPCDEFFDTRDEAIAHAVAEEHCYIGRVYNLSDDDVAAAFVREWDEADDHIRQRDEWMWKEDEVVCEPTNDACEELHQMVNAWVARHSLRVPTWRVEEIEGPCDWSDKGESGKEVTS